MRCKRGFASTRFKSRQIWIKVEWREGNGKFKWEQQEQHKCEKMFKFGKETNVNEARWRKKRSETFNRMSNGTVFICNGGKLVRFFTIGCCYFCLPCHAMHSGWKISTCIDTHTHTRALTWKITLFSIKFIWSFCNVYPIAVVGGGAGIYTTSMLHNWRAESEKVKKKRSGGKCPLRVKALKVMKVKFLLWCLITKNGMQFIDNF